MKRAAIIITDARYVDGVTLRNGDGSWNDEMEQLWLETDPQLLTDLRHLIAASPGPEAARVRALLPNTKEEA